MAQRPLQPYFTRASSQAATLGTDFDDRPFSSREFSLRVLDYWLAMFRISVAIHFLDA
jgi:hypothetical protein